MGTPVLNAVEPDPNVGGLSDFNATLKKGNNPDGFAFDWEDRGRTANPKGLLLKGQEKAALQSRELEALMNLEGEQFRSFLEKERAAFAKAYGMPTYQGLVQDGDGEAKEEEGPYSPFNPSDPAEVEEELRKVKAMVMTFVAVGNAVPPELLRRLSLLQSIYNSLQESSKMDHALSKEEFAGLRQEALAQVETQEPFPDELLRRVTNAFSMTFSKSSKVQVQTMYKSLDNGGTGAVQLARAS